MKNKYSGWMFVLLLIIGFLKPLKSVSADIGPKLPLDLFMISAHYPLLQKLEK